MTLETLVGRAVGPAGFVVGDEAVGEFVAATGDDPIRWRHHAPPGFAAAALFAVAPAFLDDPKVARHSRSLLHTEQAFTWERPLAVGEALGVQGRVTAVRSRGPLDLVLFAVAASGPGGRWMEGVSSFLLSAEAADEAAEELEPPPDERAACDSAVPLPLPAPGEALAPLRRGASRADLGRYAAATGDWNPIHREHDAARAAGLPGVVAHGLLIANWLFQAAARYRPGPDPLRSARVRFRRPLRPAVAAVITGKVAARGEAGAEVELALESAASGAPLATAAVRVTP
ncbi:MAG: MaoC family dehydratase N-terminal domain-containing protein [Actinomycetota bacterium]